MNHFNTKQSVIVTGSAGFIGLHTIKKLVEKNLYVYAFIHNNTNTELDQLKKSGKISILRANITSYESLQQAIHSAQTESSQQQRFSIQTIIHCAAYASDIGPRKKFIISNYKSIKYIIALMNTYKIKKLIFISSIAVYGIHDFEGQKESELEYNNNTGSYYTESKILAEKYIQQKLTEDRYVIIRPASVWGTSYDTITTRARTFLNLPFILYFGKWKGKNRWPLAHVDNVAKAIFIAVATEYLDGEAMHVLDSERTSIENFYKMIAKIYHPSKNHRIINLPQCLGTIIGTVCTCLSSCLRKAIDPTSFAISLISHHLDFNNAKFEQALQKYNIKPTTFEEGYQKLASA